jgi:hypothetical protein
MMEALHEGEWGRGDVRADKDNTVEVEHCNRWDVHHHIATYPIKDSKTLGAFLKEIFSSKQVGTIITLMIRVTSI